MLRSRWFSCPTFGASVLALAVSACRTSSSPNTPSETTVTVGSGTIQAAIDAAVGGATVKVGPGTYAERLTIRKPIKLQGDRAVLDGLAGNLEGRGVGISIAANDVEIAGFTIQNFERGISVDRVSNCRLSGNEIRNNTSKDPQPITPGVTKADGIALFEVQNSVISGNFVHDNGTIGLMLRESSGGNTIRGNRFLNNGTQQPPAPGGGQYGAGISSSGGNNTRNTIVDNEISHSHWGILIGGGADGANVIQDNRLHDNGRAAIAVYGQNNRIERNAATGNGALNVTPSCRADFFDFDVVDNDWTGNLGTFATGRPNPQSSCSP